MSKFCNKTVFITGAASGIGYATAIAFAAAGVNLALCDIDHSGLAAVALTCEKKGATVTIIVADVADYSACQNAIEVCIKHFGQLDILCNIAGIAQLKHFTDINVEEWQRMLAINLSGVFYLCQLAMPHLIKSQGNIVNMASSAGLVGQAYTSAYSACKAAVINLSKSLAIEYAQQQVRVNAICPGSVITPLTKSISMPADIDQALLAKMMPLLAPAQANEIATAILYLASEEARYITGTSLAIDGGQTSG
ncbi:meso-butanediol dehydrogenase / (S,S)-butanediol dehydrogenase / diacetyl reductase [Colwellia chukchiensis]|uniref:Meso-butanediol dehydrogenase / (S,S)-butanediol dehydrogenase / diacetyl reductase n=1 Tax=Colwellia chukchiensis TaxID=641665 RepID=A0A1H7MSC5_9GAMM|nr:SDR family NAD(P)-dependent oxidoreductase [Colwellia chukchiensis]SEL14124.1 meso-butanediol dehydrogenase / (S,S)-butanediol dehydrogenase / diacetyl reductase [Colwellia chukchiensis]